jgi:hypothetical protein
MANLGIAVISGLRVLPPERQQEVLDFVEFLKTRSNAKPARKSLKGLWAKHNIDLSAREMAEARQQLWSDCSTEAQGV